MIIIHSKIGYSAVSEFEQCPYRYKLNWIDQIEVLPSDDPANALIIGTALHKGIETDAETAIQEYYMTYPVISDLHINESIKLEALIPKVKEILLGASSELKHEVPVKVGDFLGTIDLLEYLGEDKDGTKLYNMYDFKYANPKNFEKYKDSRQLHIYKYMFETQTAQKIVGMYYLLVPKTAIRQKDSEDLFQFRQRLDEVLKGLEPVIIEIPYDEYKVEEYFELVDKIEKTTDYPKKPSKLCDWCKYQNYCEKGIEFMLLPKNERRPVGSAKKRRIWLYGAPFSGKTTLTDQAPDPLNLNTDGNIEFVTMPYLKIADVVTVEGRMTKRKFAWEVFKDTIEELEKKQNDFKTIVVDLVEDTREMCRLYKYDQMGIQHESDSGYGKGWDIIKTEYLSTMRRFFNMDYTNLIVISHEVVSEIKKKNGQSITKISPNIQEAVANKLAGMVDIVARVVVEDDGSRTLNFKSDEYVFGGGRLTGITKTSIPLSWDSLIDVYDTMKTPSTEKAPEGTRKGRKKAEPEIQEEVEDVTDTIMDAPEDEPDDIKEEPAKEEPKRRSRTKTEPKSEPVKEEVVQDPEPVKEEPKRRSRTKSEEVIQKVHEENFVDHQDTPPTQEPVKEEEPKRRTRKVRE